MKIGTDLVTFNNPCFWNVKTEADIATLAAADAPAFWTRILDSVRDAGVCGIELTFPPFEPSALAATFGPQSRILSELRARGLEIWSSFFADLDRIPVSEHAQSEELILARVHAASELLAHLDGKVLVAGLPCREAFPSCSHRFVDLDFAAPLAGLLNRMGAASAEHGITLAIHTEAHSVACASRDVDLFMLLTDPRYVALCPDPAHIILEGCDPVSLVRRHLSRVVAMHWKDATGPMPATTPIDANIHARHRPYFCEPGAGRVDFASLNALLAHAPLSCGPILELDSCPTPIPALERGTEFIRQIAGHTA
ncbi:sugar phosphate isomerase/epimerase family protein [Acetobacter sp. KSO5]|uniref:sugar phosphate isomerase/epimerase family protein n=1 Tax=Acetobacter sp. KSO5 TaxID=3373674 RepID=UPI00376F0E7F